MSPKVVEKHMEVKHRILSPDLVYQRFASPSGSIDISPGPGAYMTSGLSPSGGAVKFAKRDKMRTEDLVPGPNTYFEDGRTDYSQPESYSFV